MMNVKLNIEEDAELRAYIKDCIKGQVLSIIRGELIDIAKAELERKVKAISVNEAKYTIDSAANSIARSKLYDAGIRSWNDDVVRKEMISLLSAEVKKLIDRYNWEETVNKLAIEKVKSLVK